MYAELIAIVAPVMVCAALGYGWARAGMPFDSNQISSIVFNIGTPCLVVSTLTRIEIAPAALAEMGLAAALALMAAATIGYVVLRVFRLPLRDYLPAVTFGNSGNMGLPLNLFAFGEAGLALAVAFFSVAAVIQLTLGSLIASGATPLRHIVRTPIVYAVAIAAALLATGARLPEWIANTIELLGGITIPLMLLALGVSLARMHVVKIRRSLALALLRLAAGFAIGMTLAWALDFEGMARGVLILQCSMPVAVFNYLFAARYDRAHEDVAAMVVISTVVSFVTLPLLLLLVL